MCHLTKRNQSTWHNRNKIPLRSIRSRRCSLLCSLARARVHLLFDERRTCGRRHSSLFHAAHKRRLARFDRRHATHPCVCRSTLALNLEISFAFLAFGLDRNPIDLDWFIDRSNVDRINRSIESYGRPKPVHIHLISRRGGGAAVLGLEGGGTGEHKRGDAPRAPAQALLVLRGDGRPHPGTLYASAALIMYVCVCV